MSDGLDVRVVGLETLKRDMLALGSKKRMALLKEVKLLTIELQRKVKDEKLSGQVLKNQTGRLRRSITQKVIDTEDNITGLVGTVVNYGAYWERGFDRKVGAGARGGPRTLETPGALAKYFSEHPPSMKHFAPRSFLLSSLDEMRDQVRARLVSVLDGDQL